MLRRAALAVALVFAVTMAHAALPNVRPPPSKRTFNSTVINALIDDYTSRMKDPDLATLFGNCLPNTLDTTVASFTPPPNGGIAGGDAFVITGDISAQWLRDSMNQVLPYVAFAPQELKLQQMICGLMHRHWTDVAHDPYANAFNFANEGGPHQGDSRRPPMTPHVFEGKYELDSLAAVLKLARVYWNSTSDTTCFASSVSTVDGGSNSSLWLNAVDIILATMQAQQNGSAPTPDQEPYVFQRLTEQATDTQMMNGQGIPAAGGSGMVKCDFRNSDDVVTLPFNIPANAMAVVELRAVSQMLPPLFAALHADDMATDAEVARARQLSK